jgi:hypothetical protein
LRGVGLFSAVLACPIDGAFFDAALVFFSETLVRTADEVFFAGFVSSVVVVGILIPSLVGGGRSLTDR